MSPGLAGTGQVTPIGDAQRGTMVTVQGVVERITDEDGFRPVDASGRIRVHVGPNPVPADVGEAVTVSGFVDARSRTRRPASGPAEAPGISRRASRQ